MKWNEEKGIVSIYFYCGCQLIWNIILLNIPFITFENLYLFCDKMLGTNLFLTLHLIVAHYCQPCFMVWTNGIVFSWVDRYAADIL